MVDYKFEPGWLFDWQIAWLGTFQDTIHIASGPTKQVVEVRTMGLNSQ
jgi:hypothetical protein